MDWPDSVLCTAGMNGLLGKPRISGLIAFGRQQQNRGLFVSAPSATSPDHGCGPTLLTVATVSFWPLAAILKVSFDALRVRRLLHALEIS
jgi:hypothetical protein